MPETNHSRPAQHTAYQPSITPLADAAITESERQELHDARKQEQRLLKKREQVCVEFEELAVIYKMRVIRLSEKVLRPTIHRQHDTLRALYLNAEIGSCIATVGLTTLMAVLNHSFAWYLILLLVLGFCTVIWLYLPGFMIAFFEISPLQPDSINRAKIGLLFSGLIALGGGAAFLLTRTSAETQGITATLYLVSLPVAEIGFALCAAHFKLFREFYSWSLKDTEKFDGLTVELDRLEGVIASLEARLQVTISSQETNTPAAEGGPNQRTIEKQHATSANTHPSAEAGAALNHRKNHTGRSPQK